MNEMEVQLLAAIGWLLFSNRKADPANLVYLMERKLPCLLETWEQTALTLSDKGMITVSRMEKEEIGYHLTEKSREYAEELHRNNVLTQCFYNEFYERARQSRAHSEFCHLVYGADLCQHGMLDMQQLDRMLETAQLHEESRVLELGCGNGMIAEYIAEKTGCHITGIDIAARAVEQANRRTEARRNRIRFESMSMDEMSFAEGTFDTVISIDSLYFVRNLENVLNSIASLLKPKGKMYVFYHVPPDTDIPHGSSMQESSRLGIVLKKLGFCFETIDFSKENSPHWAMKKEVLLAIQHKFEEEGNQFLFLNRMEECKGNLGEYHRFLYIVRM